MKIISYIVSLSVAQAGLEFVILLLPLVKCWDNRREPTCPVSLFYGNSMEFFIKLSFFKI
jgi:hypothetical protein